MGGAAGSSVGRQGYHWPLKIHRLGRMILLSDNLWHLSLWRFVKVSTVLCVVPVLSKLILFIYGGDAWIVCGLRLTVIGVNVPARASLPIARSPLRRISL